MSLGKEDVFWERGSFITKNERMDCCFSQRRGESLSPRELPKSHRGPPCGREVVCFSSRGVNGTHRVTGGGYAVAAGGPQLTIIRWRCPGADETGSSQVANSPDPLNGTGCTALEERYHGPGCRVSRPMGLNPEIQCESISKWPETDSACGSMVDPYFKLTTKLVLNLLLHTGLHTHTTNVLEPL